MHVLLAIASLISPLAAIVLVVANFPKSQKVVPSSLVIALAMAVICMGVVSNGQGDLATYALEIESYRGLPLWDFASTKYSNYIGSSLIFWAIAQIGNAHLVQFFNGFVEYFVLSYIVFDFARSNKFDLRKTLLLVVVVASLVPLYSSISAIRSTPALDIGLLALYRDLYKSKRDALTVILYILPVTLHAIGLSMLAIRFAVLLSRGKAPISFSLGFAVLPILIFGSAIVAPFFDGLSVNPVTLLAEYNEHANTGWAATVAKSTFYQLFRAFNLIFVIAISIESMAFMSERHNVRRNGIALLNGMLVGLGLIAGFCIFVTDPAFMRFSYAIYPISALYIVGRKSLLRSDSSSCEDASATVNRASLLKVRSVLLSIACTMFFMAHCYLFYLGADFAPLLQTLFAGVFAAPQLWV